MIKKTRVFRPLRLAGGYNKNSAQQHQLTSSQAVSIKQTPPLQVFVSAATSPQINSPDSHRCGTKNYVLPPKLACFISLSFLPRPPPISCSRAYLPPTIYLSAIPPVSQSLPGVFVRVRRIFLSYHNIVTTSWATGHLYDSMTTACDTRSQSKETNINHDTYM